jgi:hypothetical protein
MMPAWDTGQEKMFSEVDPQPTREVAGMLRTILLALDDREPAAPSARRAV